MEVKNKVFLKNKRLDADYKSNRITTIVAIVASFAFGIFCYVNSRTQIAKIRQHVYVMGNDRSNTASGTVMIANQENLSSNRPAEIRHDVKMLMERLFTMAPDNSSIEENLREAEVLGDESVMNFINNLKENKYYDKLIAASTSSRALRNSFKFKLDLSHYPIGVYVTFHQELVRSTAVSLRELSFSLQVRNCPRSDDNPHGLIIERLNVEGNKLIKKYERQN